MVLPDRDFRYYLDLTCSQIRRFGRDMPEVLTAVLRLLPRRRRRSRRRRAAAEVARQVGLVLAELPDTLVEEDAADVREFARRVSLALDGDLDLAYADRAGEALHLTAPPAVLDDAVPGPARPPPQPVPSDDDPVPA